MGQELTVGGRLTCVGTPERRSGEMPTVLQSRLVIALGAWVQALEAFEQAGVRVDDHRPRMRGSGGGGGETEAENFIFRRPTDHRSIFRRSIFPPQQLPPESRAARRGYHEYADQEPPRLAWILARPG
jgi:hypothetical protein